MAAGATGATLRLATVKFVVAPEVPAIKIGIVPNGAVGDAVTVNVPGDAESTEGVIEAVAPAIAPTFKNTPVLPKLPNGVTWME